MLILYLYHLLVTITLRHSHQATEAADAVVYVNDIVTDLKLLYLLERKSNLAAPGTVGTEVVFMEAVEYLVVCEETHPQAIVNESLMESAVDGCENDARLRIGDMISRGIDKLAGCNSRVTGSQE